MCVYYGYYLIDDNGRLQNLRFCLFEMYVNVVFVISCLYSTASLTLVREQCFIRIIYYYYYYDIFFLCLSSNLLSERYQVCWLCSYVPKMTKDGFEWKVI